MKQFEVWTAKLPMADGSHVIYGVHPVIIISNDTVNHLSPVVTVIPFTSKIKRMDLETHVFIQGQGLHLDSIALCEQVTSIDKIHLIRQVGFIIDQENRYSLIRGIAIQIGIVS